MVGIECPDCKAALINEDWVEIDLPERGASKFTYQWWFCPSCGIQLYASLEEFLNVFDDDLVHIGYRVADPEKWGESLVDVAMCPDKRDRKCNCRIHRELRENGFPGKGGSVEMRLKK